MGSLQESKHSPSAPVNVESELVSGIKLPRDTRAFLGVPYAAPPVEHLRWRPPQLPSSWTGVRSADKFGPSRVQFAPPFTSIYSGGENEFSEDWLYLNIYTGPEDSQDRPVLVWFHFGELLFGSSSNPLYDGARLAAKGITVVTVNHRLGRFGFLANPELSVESGYLGSGNYGIMDQIAALEWVQRNIKAFGGTSCAAHRSLRIGASSIAELRKIPAKQITSVHLPRSKGSWKADIWPDTSSLSIFDTANPNLDGHVLPESPLSALVSGRAADVPLLAGNVGNEASVLPYLRSLAEYHEFVMTAFGEHSEEVLQFYPAETDSEVRAASSQILADQVFIYPTWSAARFSDEPEVISDADVIEKERAGAFHIVGIPYGFETLDTWKWGWTDADRALSSQFSDSWVQFVKAGNPNGSDRRRSDQDMGYHYSTRASNLTRFQDGGLLDMYYGVAAPATV